MRMIDFLFWHYYCYSEQCKKKAKTTGDSRWMSIVMIVVTIGVTLAISVALVDIFVCEVNIPERYSDKKILGWAIGIPCFLYLYYRYYKQKSIVSGKYKVFRERWGNPENVSKKNMQILLMYTLITTIGMFILAGVIGELNKRGVFAGYRLFP